MNGRIGNNLAHNGEESSSPVSQGGLNGMPANLSSNLNIPNNQHPSMGYWSSLNYNLSGGGVHHPLELQSPTSVISNYSLNRNMMKNNNRSNSMTIGNR